MSSRTKSQVNCGGVSRGASGHRKEIDYKDTGFRNGGVSMENDIVHLWGALSVIVNFSVKLLTLFIQRNNPTIFRQKDRDRTV